jgi:hypothetical protein
LSDEKPQRRLVVRWATLKGLAAIILFFMITVLIEYVVVIYAISLGAAENQQNVILGFISPLFHLVPIAVIITLVASWTFLTRYTAVRPSEAQRPKAGPPSKRGKKQRFRSVRKFFGRIESGFLKIRGVTYIWHKIHFARATIKSALTVILVFSALILLVSLMANPQLVYLTVTNIYKTNPALLNFVKGISQALAPVGQALSSVNSAFVSAAPAFRNFVVSLSAVTRPLINLDATGKYLVFQNVAAWTSAVTALVYGVYTRNHYRYRKRR